MKSFFRFEFYGWIYAIKDNFETRNGIKYKKVRVVNGTDFNLFLIFEDQEKFNEIKKGDWILVKGNIKKVDFQQNYFKVVDLKILKENAQKEENPSALKDINDVESYIQWDDFKGE